MAGESSILHMIITLRNNRNQLRSKSAYKNKSFFQTKSEYKKYSKGISDLKKATPKQLNAIRTKIISQRKADNLVKLALISILITLISLAGYYVLNLDIDTTPQVISAPSLEKSQYNFDFYVQDGNSWLRKRHWNNAIFQFQKAIEIQPENYNVHLRLALAYSYQCEHIQFNCNEAVALIDSLLQIDSTQTVLSSYRATCMEHLK